jgi:hypothetical protein
MLKQTSIPRIALMLALALPILAGSVSSVIASNQAKAICQQVGGLHVNTESSTPRFLADLGTTTISRSDLKLIGINQIYVGDHGGIVPNTWPDGAIGLVSCEKSGMCEPILNGTSRDVFVEYNYSSNVYQAISKFPTKHCSTPEAKKIKRIKYILNSEIEYYVNAYVCVMTKDQISDILFVSPPFTSKRIRNPFSIQADFNGWRVFKLNKSEPIIYYTEAGSSNFLDKIIGFVPNAMGIFNDYSGDRCHARKMYLDGKRIIVQFFDSEGKYPEGVHKFSGKAS